MSAMKRISFGVAIAWASRVVTIFSGLFLTPVLFRLINKEELGVWYLLGNSQQFLDLLGFGIGPTLTRHIAFAKGRSGADVNVELNEESIEHINNLVFTGQVILRNLAAFIFCAAWIGGYIFIHQLTLKSITPDSVLIAWTFLCAGYAIGVWASYLNCWLVGIGYVGWEGIFNTGIYLVVIISNIVVAFSGFGLVGLAIVAFTGGLIQRFTLIFFLRSIKPELFKVQGNWDTKLALNLFKPSMLAWITGLGGLIIHRTDSYFIAFFKGAEYLPTYQAAYIIVSTIYGFSTSLSASAPTFISQAWQAGDIATVHHLTIRNAQIGMSIMASGTSFLLTVGEELFNLWLGKSNFIGYSILTIFCIMFTLESQQMNLVTSARATEDEKYVPVALTAAILNIIFTWIFIKPFGLLGVAMGTMIAQMLTNNWYAVYRPIKRLRLDFKVYFKEVVLLWLQIILISMSISLFVKYFMNTLGVPEFYKIFVCFFICAFIFLAFIWSKVLDTNHQHKILLKLRSVIHWN